MDQENLMKNEKLLYLETFGCQMNVSDSEKIISMLKEVGYQQTETPSAADLIILNTCCIRAKAEQKLYSYLGRLKGLKKQNKRLIIAVGGCIAQQEGRRLLGRFPYLDMVFGTHTLFSVPEMVRAAEQGERMANVDFLDNEARLDLFPKGEDNGSVSRFVTIMQGCDNFCSYCVVPYVRGREVSRRSGEIIDEVRQLAEKGVVEVTLIGQNVNSYGLKTPGELDFPALLHEVAAVEGIKRVRFTTSHPKDISDSLIACFAELPKLCGHIHLPAQSGSDAVLARMERGYSREHYLKSIANLKRARPDILITGDMIAGFPGESEEDFQQTLSMMEEVEYADLFSFVFSVRSETKAAGFPDDLPYQAKLERLDRLQGLQRQMTLKRNRSFAGTFQEILIEGKSRRGEQFYGRTGGNRMVHCPADPFLVGSLVTVRITKAEQNYLQALLP